MQKLSSKLNQPRFICALLLVFYEGPLCLLLIQLPGSQAEYQRDVRDLGPIKFIVFVGISYCFHGLFSCTNLKFFSVIRFAFPPLVALTAFLQPVSCRQQDKEKLPFQVRNFALQCVSLCKKNWILFQKNRWSVVASNFKAISCHQLLFFSYPVVYFELLGYIYF